VERDGSERRWWTLALLLAAGGIAVVGYLVADAFFLPEASVYVDQPMPGGAVMRKEGSSVGGGAEGNRTSEGGAARNGTVEGTTESGAIAANAPPKAVRTGTFRGSDRLHNVEGTVTLYDGPDGLFLRFEGYDATDGPDVYLYLTRKPHDESTAGVEGDGARVLVPGGKEGRATLRGNFNVRLPDDGTDWAAFEGATMWCDRFNVPFGSAALEEV
jgi:hypothetical protein